MHGSSLFDRLIDATVAAANEHSLKTALSDVARAHGFERFAYLNLHTAKSFAVSTYQKEWQSLYFSRSYMAIDPVVTAAKRLRRAFRWSVDVERRRADDSIKEFYDAAAEFGIRSGLSIPIWTGFGQFAILTLASAKHLEISGSDDIDTVGAAGAAALIHARLQGTSTPTQRPDFIFSDREALCLRWAAEGLPMHSIADVTGLTYHTVRWDLDRVKAKLGVYTQKQAVAVASRFGLI
ncbi:LuxR family transcriptional regulator (plasmid) [Rhizobium ruizarguesonis]|jgi:LuxR family transcriptional activator of conjugal transfer of Ti plasmids|uniref:LuxR family transcriptional regulator n=1 Tax=Rhizobium ruizarguesonis TaxID=2081791 RepID=A0ABY1X1K9_9HYPH|nr:autoinducer binding domain-containing protein [Rhizobium ruizarguesonis]NKQ85645.1 LuxR family transcriptional regulator [Rhizobium ruizarguesonis]TAU17079.1 LuxR family transcriptional regulator [Rhizobium ruizarguesonis]TAU59291.1 LuxR family transcriptional regulator [Rhizobium ruizarguesonis]TAU71559.1 LuxR family transcriptional regulator [Rhizobium ruizarguesonis]TAV03478.1 LuxR family transcriptional regulator [Rhizobium ruizarguesonis]